MRVLLDECVPRRLRRLLPGHELPGHEVHTAREMGWDGKKNGELLALAAAAGFSALLSTDRNLRHQQTWRWIGSAAVILVARRNSPELLEPLMPQVAAALPTIRPGQLIEVGEGDSTDES